MSDIRDSMQPESTASLVSRAEAGRSAPLITLVVALARDLAIGRNNALPWHLPADLAHFKQMTLDKPIVMGRKTWESLPGLLPRRRHLVISRDPGFQAEGAEVLDSPQSVLDALSDQPEIMIVGGASIYAAFLPLADAMEITQVDLAIADADAWFPAWKDEEWRETRREHRRRDVRNPCDLAFIRLERVARG